MSFTILTTISPDYAHAWTQVMPTWFANSGADEIVVHRTDEGSWTKNTIRRNEILCAEVARRAKFGQRILRLDADCLVLRNLAEGFSDEHPISVARWPQINMGVCYFNTAVAFDWRRWMKETMTLIRQQCSGRKDSSCECDQIVWRPRLHMLPPELICKLPEWEYNYNNFDMDQWERELPTIRDIVRVIHLKGHGRWAAEKFSFAKRLFPEQLQCLG
jgi:hypothetical protein